MSKDAHENSEVANLIGRVFGRLLGQGVASQVGVNEVRFASERVRRALDAKAKLFKGPIDVANYRWQVGFRVGSWRALFESLLLELTKQRTHSLARRRLCCGYIPRPTG